MKLLGILTIAILRVCRGMLESIDDSLDILEDPEEPAVPGILGVR